jgi:hypothetical protein
MSDLAIRVENLSKRYRIGALQHRHDTLRDALVATLQRFNVPTFQRSNVPTFQRSNVSTFKRSNAPTLQHRKP